MKQPIDAQDPRLTAFALGEAEDPELPAAIAADPELASELAAIRAAAGLLAAAYQHEPAPSLNPTQRQALLAESGAGAQAAAGQGRNGEGRPRGLAKLRAFWTPGRAVAGLAGLAAVLVLVWLTQDRSGQGLALAPGAAPMEVVVDTRDQERELALVIAPTAAGVATAEAELALDYGVSGPARWMGTFDALPPDSRILPSPEPDLDFNTEAYARIYDNPFKATAQEPLSTFSIDVDTASYANLRRFLQNGERPPPDAVRIEDLLNYFSYEDPPPTDERPFAARVEVASAPWAPEHRLLRIGLKGREIPLDQRPASNLVFLVDVSGSMDHPQKLPLVQEALRELVAQLDGRDRVAMAVYAGSSGLVLPPTSGADKGALLAAIEGLEAGGSTNGGEGIELAYSLAQQGFVPGGINRVILATDGDFNVGITDQGQLTRLIEDKAKSGVFLTVLGFGMGNLQDSTMEALANRGNGNYAYIDSLSEARKVLVEELSGTLMTIAKDVKIQVEFNPAEVGAYRLIGYENRLLAAADFNDDTKDAGEIGAGHSVTALYELVPVGVVLPVPGIDPLKYQEPPQPSGEAFNGELMTVKLRYKAPEGDTSQLLIFPVRESGADIEAASNDLKWAAAVAAFGMLLRDSPHKAGASFDLARSLAEAGRGADPSGRRAEFLSLIELARGLERR